MIKNKECLRVGIKIKNGSPWIFIGCKIVLKYTESTRLIEVAQETKKKGKSSADQIAVDSAHGIIFSMWKSVTDGSLWLAFKQVRILRDACWINLDGLPDVDFDWTSAPKILKSPALENKPKTDEQALLIKLVIVGNKDLSTNNSLIN